MGRSRGEIRSSKAGTRGASVEIMDYDNPPPSLETRMLVESFKGDSGYPFLRAVRWMLYVTAALYGATALLMCVALLGDEVTSSTRETIVAMGGPEKGTGFVVAFVYLVAVALRVVVILACAEGIKLALDLKRQQGEIVRKHDEVVSAVERMARPSVRQAS